MVEYIVEIGPGPGSLRKYEFHKLHYRREASLEPQAFNAFIEVPGPTIPVIGNIFQITRILGNEKIVKFKGTVEALTESSSQKSILNVTGRDLKAKLQYLKTINTSYSATKGSAIVNPEAITDTGLTAGTINITDIALDTVSFGKVEGSTVIKFDRRLALEATQMMADFGAAEKGAEIKVRTTGEVDYNKQVGTDRSASIVFEVGLNCEFASDQGYVNSEFGKVLRVEVKGKGVGTKDLKQGSAQDAGYLASSKLRTVELPFIVSNATANNAAKAILDELNKTAQYAMIDVTDVLPSPNNAWDVFDTVKLKARLKTQTVNLNLRIYSIDIDVSPQAENVERIQVELLNYKRAIFAPLIIDSLASKGNDSQLEMGIRSTQLQDHVGASGGASEITDIAATRTENVITSAAFVTIATNTFAATPKTAGCHIILGLSIMPIVTGVDFLLLKANDGVTDYPTGTQVRVQYSDRAFHDGYAETHIFIPADVAGKTVTIQALTLSPSVVLLNALPVYYTIGEHTH